MEIAARVLASLEHLVTRRLGVAVVFASSLAAYGVRAVAWPLVGGRDLDDYLRYYVQILDRHPLLPAIQLTKTPLTPIVDGSLLGLAGGRLAEPALAVLYALSVAAWVAAARHFGSRAALGVALVLLVYPAYGALFHELSSEAVFATTFAVWALLLVRAAVAPSIGRFALVGGGVAALTLVRPGNQVLVVAGLLGFVVGPGRLGVRAARIGALVVAAVLPLVAWALVNDLRYGELTVARGGDGVLFHHSFVVDRDVETSNGPATRKVLAAIEQHLLTRDPYRSYGVTLRDVLDSGSLRVSEDIGLFANDLWGWNRGGSVLGDAGREAVRAHPGKYAADVLRTLRSELDGPYYRAIPGSVPAAASVPAAGGSDTIVVNGVRLPRPSEGDVIPSGQNGWIARPDHAIRQVWTSPTAYTFVFATAREKARFYGIQHRLDQLFAALPHRTGNRTLAIRLNQLGRWFPRPWLWLGSGVILLVVRRPGRSLVLLALAAVALVPVVATAMATPADVRYLLPVAPAFVLLALGALFGPRRSAETQLDP